MSIPHTAFELFLSSPDAARARGALTKLTIRDFPAFALTGSLALEAHLNWLGHGCGIRALNDVDIVVESFESIPGCLAETFLFRHIHPKAPEGKTLLQLVDPEAALRIDVFRACGASIARSRQVGFETCSVQLISVEDLAARTASLVMDLELGKEVPLKHARDFERLAGAIEFDRIEIAWKDHRKDSDPETFREAAARIPGLLRSRRDLLVIPEYSQDAHSMCPKCEDTGPFRRESPAKILSILGYC